MTAIDPAFQLEQELLRRELARRNMLDFLTYTKPDFEVAHYHREMAEILDAFLQAVDERKAPRMMIWLPPGHSKTEFVSRRMPAFALGRRPSLEWITSTYNQDFGNLLGRDVRRVMEDPAFKAIFPDLTIRKDSNSIDQFETTKGGKYTVLGVGGGIAGRRGHVLAIDDPIKGKEAADSETERAKLKNWYTSDFRTRIHPGAGIVVVQTRWSMDDLSGFLLDIAKQNGEADQWLVYSFPAIAEKDETFRKKGEALHPERYSLGELRKIRATYEAADNMRDWHALYMQNPCPPEGIHFKREWFQYGIPPTGAKLNRYVSTDFAISEKTTADNTVLWPFDVDDQGDIWFGIPDAGHFNAFEIVERLCDLMAAPNPRPVQLALENVHISKTIGPYLRKRMRERRIYTTVWDYTATKDKLARSSSGRGRLQQRRVHFHPACRDIIEAEFLPFPAAKHDDHVDTFSVGMLMLDELLTAPGPPAEPEAGPPEWSMEWMKLRLTRAPETRKHVPLHLSGKPREAKKRQSTWKE